MALMTEAQRNAAFSRASRSGSSMGGRSRADQDPRKEMDNYQAAVTEMKESTGKSNLGMDAHAELSKKHLGYDNTAKSRKYLAETSTKDRHWDDKNVTYGANGPNPLTYARRMEIDPNHGKVGDDPRALAEQARKHTAYKNDTGERSEAKERAQSFQKEKGSNVSDIRSQVSAGNAGFS